MNDIENLYITAQNKAANDNNYMPQYQRIHSLYIKYNRGDDIKDIAEEILKYEDIKFLKELI